MAFKFFTRDKKKEYSDEELLSVYKETGDTEYFGQLYNRYLPLIYGLCLKYLQDEDKAQDAVMDVFENLLPKITNYNIGVFRTWIYSVVKNHCFHLLRENKREMIVDFNSQIMESDNVLDLFDEIKNNEDREDVLTKCIEKLPDPQRISISKFFLEDMSYADIVDHTGYNMKSVKSYIQNGKRNLKNCIERNEDK